MVWADCCEEIFLCCNRLRGATMLTEAGPEQATIIMTPDDLRRALTRMGHELVERNAGVDGLVLVGVRTRGLPMASRLAAQIASLEGTEVPHGGLDVTFYRDDLER